MFVVDLRNSTQKSYMFSVMGNKNVDKVYIYSRFTQYADKHVYVKVLGENFADKILIDSNDIQVKNGCLIVKWTMGEAVTYDKKIQIQLQFEDVTNDLIDQSMIVSITLANTLPVGEIIPPPAPSILQQILNDINQLQGHSVADVDVGFENGTLTITLSNIEEEEIGSVQVELPTEECYVGATWNANNNQKIILTKNNGQTTELDLSDVFTAIGEVSTALTNHKNSKSNPHQVTKEQVGLGNVDNTSDQDKPVSTAQQQALNGKVDKVEGKGLSTNDFTNSLKEKLQNILFTTQADKVYGTNGNGEQTAHSVSTTASADTIVKRDANGRVATANPTSPTDATNKDYVDTIIANIKRDSYKPVDITQYPTLNDFLASTGEEGFLYLYPIDTTEAPTFNSGFYRYVWENNAWLYLGTTQIDLSNYYTKPQTDEIFATKVEAQKMVSITYAELKALRDNGQLIPGKQYRIIDYECFTSQFDTRSAGHPFDIIVTANDENHLNENAKACHSVRDNLTDIYSGTNGEWYKRKPEADGDYQGVHYYAFYTRRNNNYDIYVYTTSLSEKPTAENVYIFYVNGNAYSNIHEATPNAVLTFDDEGETIDDYKGFYFENCKLEAWELKYRLDNDDEKFSWVGQMITNLETPHSNGLPLIRQPSFDYQGTGEYQFAWGTQADVDDYDNVNFVYSKTPLLTNGEIVWNNNDWEEQVAEVSSAKGVIYFMRDEWGNECPYDFKNIQFKRYLVNVDDNSNEDFDGKYVGIKDSYGACYPNGYTIPSDEDFVWFYTFTGQKVLYDSEDETIYNPDDIDSSTELFDLSIVNMNGWYDENYICIGCSNNVIKETVNYLASLNTQMLNNIVFIGWFVDDKSLPQDYRAKCGDTIFTMMSAPSNNIFENDCFFMTFGNWCSGNTFGELCYFGVFGDECSNNSFGESNSYLLFSQYCQRNSFGCECSNNSFGESSSGNSFDNSCYGNILISSGNNKFGASCNSNKLNGSYHNSFGGSCTFNELTDSQYNTFGVGCYNNKLDAQCLNNSFGNECSNNEMGMYCFANSFGNNCISIVFGGYCQHNSFGNRCSAIKIGSSSGTKNYAQFLKVTRSSNLYINSTGTTNQWNKIINISIDCINGASSSNRTTITAQLNQECVEYKPANSNIILV